MEFKVIKRVDLAALKRNAYQQIADSLGKTIEELVPWADYDPINLDNGCYQEYKGNGGGVRYVGD
jgi:hypothetical protein